MKNHAKIKKTTCFYEKLCFSEKKNLRQGCTTQKTELGMHQNLHFQLNPLRNQKNPEINPKSTGKKTLNYQSENDVHAELTTRANHILCCSSSSWLIGAHVPLTVYQYGGLSKIHPISCFTHKGAMCKKRKKGRLVTDDQDAHPSLKNAWDAKTPSS